MEENFSPGGESDPAPEAPRKIHFWRTDPRLVHSELLGMLQSGVKNPRMGIDQKASRSIRRGQAGVAAIFLSWEGGQYPISRKRDWVHAGRMVTPQSSPALATATTPTAPRPSEDEIRDYANHLYVQRGSLNGHDRDDWLEAEACLGASIPKESSRTRMHHHTQITERAALPLVKHGRS
jgi:hypothetical protein